MEHKPSDPSHKIVDRTREPDVAAQIRRWPYSASAAQSNGGRTRSQISDASVSPIKAAFVTKIIHHMGRALEAAQKREYPFRHWLIENALPNSVVAKVLSAILPVEIAEPTERLGHCNASGFITADLQRASAASAALAEAVQSRDLARLLRDVLRTDVEGSYLQIEYIPHGHHAGGTPIGDKRDKVFSMLVPVCGGDQTPAKPLQTGRTRSGPGYYSVEINSAVMLGPAHGALFKSRERESLAMFCRLEISYVRPIWRIPGQLCFPDRPISVQ